MMQHGVHTVGTGWRLCRCELDMASSMMTPAPGKSAAAGLPVREPSGCCEMSHP